MIYEDSISVTTPTWRENASLIERMAAIIPAHRARVTRLVRSHGSHVVDQVTVERLYGGLRGMTVLVSEISKVDPLCGIRLRGYTIQEVLDLLPKAPGADYPLAGGLYYLLVMGEMPTYDDAALVENEWKARCQVPEYVFKVLKSLPADTHPMTMFSQAILSMQHESVFARRYNEDLQKVDYWEAALEDSLNLTAKLPTIAAYIYNLRYRDGQYIAPNPNLDWSANFGHMIGKGADTDYLELCRLFFVLHSDHEGANVSAHTAHLVGSTLSDIYYSCSAAINGLAGPLHGLANQKCLRWLLSVREGFENFPTRDELETFAWETLNAGKVIPGYGHAVLRTVDPRFTAQLEFANKYLPQDDLFQLVKLVYEVVPDVLQKTGKVKNPWPNVDAINGTLQYHYGVKEFEFYTVLFGVGRIMGITANNVWARALGLPIERPVSLTTENLEQLTGNDTNQI
jgi:citrate synthase